VEIIMLWFKNLMVYRLSRDVSLRAEEMEKQLAAYTFSLAVARIWRKPVGFRQWVHKAMH
jgi:DNA recombination-dependent growth factor C